MTQLYQFYTVQYEKQVEESAQVVEVLREPTEQLRTEVTQFFQL